ncbi:MAG: hypothetical protein JO323_05395 [Acidobacteriia bacterium]|nr:hypothetical protein [Terriglobia bacterium]
MVRVRQETLRHEGYGEPGRLHVMAGTLGIMLDAMEKHNIATPGDPLLKGVDELGLSADGAPRRASQLISDGVTLASINQAILNPEEAAQRVAMLITRYPDAALIALAESGGPLGRSKQANLNAEIQAHFSPGHVPSRTRDGGTSR